MKALRIEVVISQIKQVEGVQGYFKGLGPNLVGVIPARYN